MARLNLPRPPWPIVGLLLVALAALVVLVVGGLRGDDGIGEGSGAPPSTGPGGVVLPSEPSDRATAAEVPLAVGECYDVDGLGAGLPVDPAALRPVPCEGPHTVEVALVSAHPLGPDADHPGQAAVDGFAVQACLDGFEAYVGTPYEASRLDVTVVAPGTEGWAEGDRRIACLVYDTDFTPLPGPAAGSGR